jgi:MYXO-CTERM domain-containing protein
MTWTEYPIPMFNSATENGVYVSGVDPTNPERVYIRSALAGGTVPTPPDTAPGRLFVTSDGGQTFTVAYSAGGPIFGFALSDDGSKVYLGGITYPDAGNRQGWIDVASSTDLTFTQTSDVLALCLTYTGGILYVCANTASGFVVGTSTNDGATITPLLPALCDIDGPMMCEPDASTSVCEAQWTGPLGLYEYTFQCMPDAGTPADAGVKPPAPPPKSSGCGCRVAPTQGAAVFFVVGALGVLGLAARRARRKL